WSRAPAAWPRSAGRRVRGGRRGERSGGVDSGRLRRDGRVRLMAAVLKTAVVTSHRGFESLSLRHVISQDIGNTPNPRFLVADALGAACPPWSAPTTASRAAVPELLTGSGHWDATSVFA